MSWMGRAILLRTMRAEWAQSLLALATIALGVGVFLAIQLANQSAIASFEGLNRNVGITADLILRKASGSLDDGDLVHLRPLLGIAELRPVLEGTFQAGGDDGTFRVVGLDLVGLAGAGTGRNSLVGDVDDKGFFERLEHSRAVYVTSAFVAGRRDRVGSSLEGWVDARPVTLRIEGVLSGVGGRVSLERNILVMDLPAAQDLLGRPGCLDRVELTAREGQDSVTLAQRAKELAGPGFEVEPPEYRAETGRKLTAAFRFNLLILSLLALAVGVYLLSQELEALVFRRRETWALLHSLGCPPWWLQSLVLAEAALLGILGSCMGVLLGWGLAQFAVKAVSRTLGSLYGPSEAAWVGLSWSHVLGGILLGTLCCILAAWPPSMHAAATAPTEILARGSQARPMRWGRYVAFGSLCILGGSTLAFLPRVPPGMVWHGYLGAALLLLGGSLVPIALMPLAGWLLGSRRSWILHLACRPLRAPTGRHAWSCAALAVSIAMGTGLGIMIASFRSTVQSWLEQSLKSDVYVAPAGFRGAHSEPRLPPSLVRDVLTTKGVAGGETFQLATLEYLGQPIFLGASDFARQMTRPTLKLVNGGSLGSIKGNAGSKGLSPRELGFVSEAFSRRFRVGVGDTLCLSTPSGPHGMRVDGIYSDFSNERGGIIVDCSRFREWFGGEKIASLALDLAPGTEADAVAESLRRRFPGLQVRVNAALRSEILGIFDQTFALTYSLQAIGLAVALIGLLIAMSALVLLRRADIWTLRALGATDGEIVGTLLGEGLGTAAAGIAGGLILGVLLSLVLVRVINPQVFGWTLAFTWPWGLLSSIAAIALAVSTCAILPLAWWGARLESDREEEEGV